MTSSIKKQHHVGYCGGRACPVCHKCADWYYDQSEHTDCDPSVHVYEEHVGPLIGPRYDWHRRVGATCGFHAYPHYVYYVAYHGNCPYNPPRSCPPSAYNSDRSHGHHSFRPANHGPHICHCEFKKPI